MKCAVAPDAAGASYDERCIGRRQLSTGWSRSLARDRHHAAPFARAAGTRDHEGVAREIDMTLLRTKRLELVPMTLEMVEAVMLGRRGDSEVFAGARMPERWPNHELIERAFPISLDEMRADPAARLWGARVMITGGGPGQEGAPAEERRVVGSVVFRHGYPDDGVAEIAYGVEEGSQRRGYATEAVTACVAWALAQDGVRAVQAATFEWHQPSVRVLRASGMTHVGAREHETMGEMAVFERESSGMKARNPV